MSLKLSLPGVARCHCYRIAVGGAEVGPSTARRLLLTIEGTSRLIVPVIGSLVPAPRTGAPIRDLALNAAAAGSWTSTPAPSLSALQDSGRDDQQIPGMADPNPGCPAAIVHRPGAGLKGGVRRIQHGAVRVPLFTCKRERFRRLIHGRGR